LKRRLFGYGFVLLMVFGIAFASQDKNGFSFGDRILQRIGLEAWSNPEQNMGFHYTVLYSLVFIIGGWWGAVRLLKEIHPKIDRRMVVLFFITLFFLAHPINTVVKQMYYSWQSGIDAIEYYPKESRCTVSRMDENGPATLDCQFTFENHQSYPQRFRIKWKGEEIFQGAITLTFNERPYIVEIPAEHKVSVSLHTEVEDGQILIHSGEFVGPELILAKEEL
jgi:hypothetical protein